MAGGQWNLVEPIPLADRNTSPANPTALPWMTETLATQYSWMAFENGVKKDLFVEQVLANELGTQIESQEGPREMTLVRLEELFRPVLYRESIDQDWSDERRIDSIFESDEEYLALTQRGSYEGMVSRLTVLNEFVRLMVERANE